MYLGAPDRCVRYEIGRSSKPGPSLVQAESSNERPGAAARASRARHSCLWHHRISIGFSRSDLPLPRVGVSSEGGFTSDRA